MHYFYKFFVSFFFFCIFSSFTVSALTIVSREEWWANEELRFLDSAEWQKKLEEPKKPLTEAQKEKQKKYLRIQKQLRQDFPEESIPVKYVTHENGRELAWPLSYTKYVKRIVVHHSDSDPDVETEAQAVRNIYRYHTLSNGWGDIGYNYIIGRDGTIFEWRAGGDYVVGAHARWNNASSVGILLIGDYVDKEPPRIQLESFIKLVKFLAEKYGIDIHKKTLAHKECTYQSSCIDNDVINVSQPGLVGHRDVGYTLCPGEFIHNLLWKIRDKKDFTTGYEFVENTDVSKVAENNIKKQVEEKNLENPDIRVRLSYPHENSIIVSWYEETSMKILLGKNITTKKSIEIIPYKDDLAIKISSKIIPLERDILRVSGEILEIESWDRVPAWDVNGIYNDNLFRNILEIRNDNGKLLIINELPLESYLKGLGEVSNGDLPEKIKSILISARTYALFYLTQDKKYPGQPYDGTDDPNSFQRYLGYSLELRSPNINKIVTETAGTVLYYNNKIIKPWYFNSSNGTTKSFKMYCEQQGGTSCEDIPFLQSVEDPSPKNTKFIGHGVWLSGNGATYMAESGKTAEEILQHFFTGITIEKYHP